MKPGEELMLLLELNNFDVTRYKLNKQIEYEKSEVLDVFHHEKFAYLVLNFYSQKDGKNILHKNPLTHRNTSDEEIKSLHQFIITHSDLNDGITFGEFLLLSQFDDIHKRLILNDILNSWIGEYHEANTAKMNNLKEMISLIPLKDRKYRRPRITSFFISILLTVLLVLLFSYSTFLQPAFSNMTSSYLNDWNQLLYDDSWYSIFGASIIFVLAFHAILSDYFSRYIREVKGDEHSSSNKIFSKWEKSMDKAKLKQSMILQKYAELVLKKPNKSFLKLKKIYGPEILMDQYKEDVKRLERKYSFLAKHYLKLINVLASIYILSLIASVIFAGLGFILIRGWINV